MRKNVFLGLEPLTVKGDEHVFEHNTGDRSTMVGLAAVTTHYLLVSVV